MFSGRCRSWFVGAQASRSRFSLVRFVREAPCSRLSQSFLIDCDLWSSPSRSGGRPLSLAASSATLSPLSTLRPSSRLWAHLLLKAERSRENRLLHPLSRSASLSQRECLSNLMWSLSKDSQTRFSRITCQATSATVELGSTGIVGIGLMTI